MKTCQHCPDDGCNRPSWWCGHSGSVYWNKDCDGDGNADHVCSDTDGNFGVIQSNSGCQDSWPRGSCGGKMSVKHGSCTLNGGCLYSPNFPANYGDNQRCHVDVLQSGVLVVMDFVIEECCDFLYVDNVQWLPNDGDTKAVTPGTEIKFFSDYSVSKEGFSICML